MFDGSLSSVLIVENESGEVFIVEDKNNKKKPKKLTESKKSEEIYFDPGSPVKRSRRKYREEEDLQDLDDEPVKIK